MGIARKIALTGMLGALALTLSFLESLLPPLPGTPPGFKLGLSNLSAMYAAGALGLSPALFLGVLKGGFAFLSRGAAAGAMSLSGGLSAALATWLLSKKRDLSYILLGVGGALAHNAGQLFAAFLLTGVPVLGYVPLLLLYGILSGSLTGTVLGTLLPALKRWEKKDRSS